jgi:hypothetical protein
MLENYFASISLRNEPFTKTEKSNSHSSATTTDLRFNAAANHCAITHITVLLIDITEAKEGQMDRVRFVKGYYRSTWARGVNLRAASPIETAKMANQGIPHQEARGGIPSISLTSPGEAISRPNSRAILTILATNSALFLANLPFSI